MPKIIPEGEGLAAQVIFRITSADRAILDEQVQTLKIIGVRSPNQLARKVIVDYIRGKLNYTNESDRHQRPET